METRSYKAAGVTGTAVTLGLLAAYCSHHWFYIDALQSVETCVAICALFFVVVEVRKVSEEVGGVYNYTVTESHDLPKGLQVGSQVRVLMPQAGKVKEEWPYSAEIWVIREIDKETNRATATPVLPPLGGQMPTVTGPMNGPFSPFVRIDIPS